MRGLLCAGLDVEQENESDFLEWHSREHLVERMGVPGFLKGRRFHQSESSPHYLILYEVESLSVLSSAPYLERLNRPTPWTIKASKAMRSGFRSAYQLVWSGAGMEGGYILAIRFSPDDPVNSPAKVQAYAQERLLGNCGIVNAWLACPDQPTSTISTVESRQSGNAYAPEWLLLVEGVSEAALRLVLTNELSAQRFRAWGVDRPPIAGIFQLQARIDRHAVSAT